jgi:hypothetical protein
MEILSTRIEEVVFRLVEEANEIGIETADDSDFAYSDELI